MFNRKKVCPKCEWQMKYDKDCDRNNIQDYKVCPHCGHDLEDQPFSPEL